MNQATEPSSPRLRGRPISLGRTWLCGTWIWGAVLVLLVVIVFWPTLGSGFLFDDEYYVQHNLSLRSLPGLSNIWFKLDTFEQYYPLVFSTFWAEYHLWELDPRGYHAVNLLLHAASAVLVWRLLNRLAVPGAWLAAAIFAVHPIQVENIAMMHERKNVLSCLLALGSILAYLRFDPPEKADSADAPARTGGGGWLLYALAMLLFVGALLSKTVTASVPAVLLVIYWWKRGRITWRDARRTAPFFAIGLALALTTLSMEKALGASGNEWNFSLAERLLIAGRALWFYAGTILWPHTLMWIYPRWVIDSHLGWQYLYPAAAALVIVGLWLAQNRIGRGPLAAVLIFAGVLVPGLGFVNLYMFRFTFVVDYIQYHASIALIALAAASAALVASRLPNTVRWLAPAAAAGLLLPLGVVAHERAQVWQDNLAVWDHDAATDPQSWVAHHGLGVNFEQRGEYEKALAHFRREIELREQMARDNPTLSEYENEVAWAYLDAGSVQRKMGPAAEAENSIRQAIAIRERLVHEQPRVSDYQDSLAWSYSTLADVQKQSGRPDEAEAARRKAIEVRERLARDNPTKSQYQYRLAAVYADLGLLEREIGRLAEAQSSLLRAITIREPLVRDQPTVAEYLAGLAASYEDLAILQQASGRAAEARASLRKAIAMRETLAHDNEQLTIARQLGVTEIRQNLVQDILTVSKYQDQLAASYVDVGLLERDMGRVAEAASDFRKAIAIREKLVRDQPAASAYQDGLAWCYLHLADALQKTGQPDEAEAFHRKAIDIRQKLKPPDKSPR